MDEQVLTPKSSYNEDEARIETCCGGAGNTSYSWNQS